MLNLYGFDGKFGTEDPAQNLYNTYIVLKEDPETEETGHAFIKDIVGLSAPKEFKDAYYDLTEIHQLIEELILDGNLHKLLVLWEFDGEFGDTMPSDSLTSTFEGMYEDQEAFNDSYLLFLTDILDFNK